MGVQIEGGFYSENGGNYDISIYNDSFVGSSESVTVTGLEIMYESPDDEILEPLKASRCSFRFLNNSAAVDTFITNLVNGKEDQFKIVVEKQNDLFWCGVVLIDQVSFEDKPKARVVEITAIDGIGRLQEIEFDYNTSDTNTMLKYIYECLEYNDLSQYWGVNDAYFKESCDVYDTQMTNTGTSYSPLLQTRFSRFLLLTDEVTGERVVTRTLTSGATARITLPTYRPLMCSDVLRAILQITCCRMFMSDGVYYIQQIHNFSASSYNERSIKKDLTVASYQTVSHRIEEGTDVIREGNCRWTYLAPLQQTRLDSIPISTLAQSGGGILTLDNTGSKIQEVQLGTLKGGSGSGKSLKIRLSFNVPFTGSSLPTIMEMSLNIEAGSYRLYSTPQKPDIVKWTTTGTDRVTRQFTYRDLAKTSEIIYIDIDTPEMPFASEANCELSVEWSSLGTWAGSNFIKIHPIQISLLTDGELIQESQYVVINQNATDVKQYSKVIDYGIPLLNDYSLGLSSQNTFEVNSTGSTWVFSDVWNAGYSSNESLVKTLCLEAMSLQNIAVEVLQGTIKVPKSLVGVVPHTPLFWQTYYYGSDTYFMNGGTLNCVTDEFTGSYVQYVQTKTSLSIVENNGDGVAYDRNIKIGTPKKDAFDPDKWTRNAMYTIVNKQLSTLDGSISTSGGAITSLAVTSLDRKLYVDDQIIIVHPVNNRIMDTFVLSADAVASAVSISVDSKTPSEDLPDGALIMFNEQTIKDSGIFRTTNSSTPPAGGFGGDGAIQIGLSDGNLYYQSNGDTYIVSGIIKT